MSDSKHVTYEDAGVDTAEGGRAVDAIKQMVKDTNRPEVIGGIGGFGGLFSAAALKDMEDPILISGTDGAATLGGIDAGVLVRHMLAVAHLSLPLPLPWRRAGAKRCS